MKMISLTNEKIVDFVKRVMGMADVMSNKIIRAIYNGQETLVYPYDDFTKIVQDIKIKEIQAKLAGFKA